MTHPRLAVAVACIALAVPGCSLFKKPIPKSQQFVLAAVFTATGQMGIYSPEHKGVKLFVTLEECEAVKATEQAKFDETYGKDMVMTACARYKDVDKEGAAQADAATK